MQKSTDLKKIFLIIAALFNAVFLFAQLSAAPATTAPSRFFEVIRIEATSVKNQAMTGTCWCFSTTSLLESDEIRKDKKQIDLSEMFSVRNIYIEKAKNYILRQGHAQFSEGGLGHDMIHAAAVYGAIPLELYTGLPEGQKMYDHQQLFAQLQKYLDSILAKQPIPVNWLSGYTRILDDNMGVPPAEFSFEGKNYTPISFAKDVLKFNGDDYVSLTSFTHQPFYQSFILQVPDNFANGSFFNLPLPELISVVKEAVKKGYSVAWDADVSNNGFMQGAGLALYLPDSIKYTGDMINADMKETNYDVSVRQQLYENLTTQDDHLMHITGVEKTKEGKTFFIVKNSWGLVGPYKGYIHVSEAYFAINTISIVVPKSALSDELQIRLSGK